MNYETHFDLAAMPFPYERPLGMIALGIVAFTYGAYRIYTMDLTVWRILRNYKVLALVAAGTFLVGYQVRNSWEFFWMRSAAASGEVERIEGIVQDHETKRPGMTPSSISASAPSSSFSSTAMATNPSSTMAAGKRPSYATICVCVSPTS